MNRPVSFAAFLSLLSVAALPAQPAEPKLPSSSVLPTLMAADAINAEFQALQVPAAAGLQLAPRDQIVQFQKSADLARAFRIKYPGRAEASDAKLLEAKNLLSALLAGDVSQKARTVALVVEIRPDPRIPAKARLEIVAMSEVVRLQPIARQRDAFLSASEASARNLIAEFSQEAGGYEALFRLAENHPDEAKGTALAQELMTMRAPDSVRNLAQPFLERRALVGQSLPTLAGLALGSSNPLNAVAGKPVIFYSWSGDDPASLAAARAIRKIAPAGVAVIGVNLDYDLAAARGVEKSNSLPGLQLYDERGRGSPLVQALKLTTAFHVYLANARGEIRDVSAERGDLAAKLTSIAP